MSYTKGFRISTSATINGNCPACFSSDKPKNGYLILRTGNFGKFLGCSRYPDCKYTSTTQIKNGKIKDV